MRIAVLFAVTITAGIIAGFFWTYSISVMPALRGAGAAVLVETMQRINTAVQNGWFFLCFMGTPVLGAVAAVLYGLSGPPAVFVPVLVGLVLQVAQLALTFGLHIPLNNGLDAAGPPGRVADPEAARRVYEVRWVRWNHVRTMFTIGSFAAFTWALTQA